MLKPKSEAVGSRECPLLQRTQGWRTRLHQSITKPEQTDSAIETSIACTLAANGSLYRCNNTSAGYSVSAGDQVIVIVTPPSGETGEPSYCNNRRSVEIALHGTLLLCNVRGVLTPEKACTIIIHEAYTRANLSIRDTGCILFGLCEREWPDHNPRTRCAGAV